MLHSVLQGFLVGIGLIIAIERKMLCTETRLKATIYLWVCLVCVISDSLLIFAGVFGFAAVLQAHANWVEMAKYFGAIFLFLYGLQHFYHAWSKQYLVAAGKEESSLLRVLLLCLALTWLNPHVYLDTVVLIGSISTQIQGSKLDFALGASLASFLFFFSLGYGAKYLQPLFQDYRAWKVLDVGIGCLMWGIAYRLII